MNCRQWFLLGALLELVGLTIVLIGISRTAQEFLGVPTIRERVKGLFARVLSMFRRSAPSTVELSASGSIGVSGTARMKVIHSFQGTLEERIVRLQELVTRHEDALDKLHDQISSERAARIKLAKHEEQKRLELERRLEERIKIAAASDLGLQRLGVLFVGAGLVLSVWANYC